MIRRKRSPRIPREVPVSNRQPDARRDSTHLALIRQLPCIACGREGMTVAAHLRSGTDGGTGLKPADRWTTPLCSPCHDRQHRVGELTFWSDLGIDPTGAANALWTKSGDIAAMRRIVDRALQPVARNRA